MPQGLKAYLHFIASHPSLLVFGMAMTFCSSFGQTFFISLFNEPLREAFSLSHGEFGAIYLAATCLSAATIIWAGLKVDDVELRRYTTIVLLGYTVAAVLMATAIHPIMLFIALFGLRLTGQGLFGHIATVTMARYLGPNRGKGLSVSALGMPLGEAFWPPAITLLLVSAGLHWRASWLMIAGFLVLIILPAIWLLLRGQGQRDAALAAERAEQPSEGKRIKQSELIRDGRFIGIMPYILAPPFILTGIFFHQQALATDRGWPLAEMAAFFSLYAVGSLSASLTIGPIVDKLSATKLVPITCIPLALGMTIFASTDAKLGGALLFLLAGISTGTAIPILNAMWAEVYGLADLGAVRALVSALMVLSTAIAPPIFGIALDYGYGGSAIVGGALAYLAGAYLLMLTQYPRLKAGAATRAASA
ncbi:MAG: MFS transporter [Alphaproteobacteria bacterium]|nr:MFS transporter [Alphaproteobacteria bacterium SS10]